MLINFFYHLRASRLPVSINELLTLLAALKRDVIGPSIDEFYFLSRATLVKDEANYDKFDRAFGEFFNGVQASAGLLKEVPDEWFKEVLEREFTPEELAKLEALGWERLMEEFRKRLEEQNEAHHGGNKWIGSGGTSPFGHGGRHPEGIRIGGPGKGNKSAVKVWEARAYRDYDDEVEIGTRNIKVALRRLRRFAREGADLELDLHDTIESTAKNAGWLDLKLVPERHNAVKVLMLLDVGGTMDEHIRRVEELFSATKAEFKHLEFYYFHNCLYERLWRNNHRRFAEKFDTADVLRKYNPDYKLIFVGDATMSPYEILQPGGSVEHNNPEAGAVWLQRFTQHFPKYVWINPEPEGLWQYRQSIALVRQLLGDRMYPLTLEGLTRAMRTLSK
jgi:uncharacterized protein with von Willebrand factor type A (vWA) domain